MAAGFKQSHYFKWGNWIGILTVFQREIKREWRFFGVSLVGPALQSLLFALVFTLAAADSVNEMAGLPYIDFLAPGLVMAVGLQRAFESTAFGLLEDKLEGTLNDLLGAPLHAFEILLGQAFSSLVIAICISASVFLVMLFFGLSWPKMPFWMIGYFLIGHLLFSTLGILSAMLSEKWDSLAGKETFLIAPLIFLSGTFFTVDLLPDYLQGWFLINPVYYVIEGFRQSVLGVFGPSHHEGFFYAGFVAVFLWVMCLFLYSKGYRLKQ